MEAAQEGHLELVKYLLAAGMCSEQGIKPTDTMDLMCFGRYLGFG